MIFYVFNIFINFRCFEVQNSQIHVKSNKIQDKIQKPNVSLLHYALFVVSPNQKRVQQKFCNQGNNIFESNCPLWSI